MNNFIKSQVKTHHHNTCVTSVELIDMEGDKYAVSFSSVSGNSGLTSAALKLGAKIEPLYDDQIGDVFGAILDVIYAQKDRTPEIVERIETIMRYRLGEGMATGDSTIRAVDQTTAENT